MKKKYVAPECECIEIKMNKDVLIISSTSVVDETIPEAGGIVPDDDPFND